MQRLSRVPVYFIFLIVFLNGCSTPDDPIVEIVDPKPDVEVPAFDSSTLLGTYIFSFANESEDHIYQFNADNSVLIKHPDNTLDTEVWSVNKTGELVITGSVYNVFTLTSGDQLSGVVDIVLRNAGNIDTEIITTGTVAKQTAAFDKATLLGVYKLTLTEESYLYQFNADNTVVIKHADNSLDTESWSVNELGQLVVTGSITNVFTLTSGDQVAGKLNILLQESGTESAFTGTIAKQTLAFDSATMTGAYILTFATQGGVQVYQFNADNSVLINSTENISSTESWSVNDVGQLVITGSVHDFFTLTSGDQTAGEVNVLLQDAAGTKPAVNTTGTIAVQTSTFDNTMLSGVYEFIFAGEELAESYQFNADNSLVMKHADNSLDVENWSVNSFGQLVVTGAVQNLFTLISGDQAAGELQIILRDAAGIEPAVHTTATIAKQNYAFESATLPETYAVSMAVKEEIQVYQFKADNSVVIKYADRTTETETWSVNELGQLVVTGSVQTIFTLTSGDQTTGEINVVLQDKEGSEPDINTTGTIEIKIPAFESVTLPETYNITFAHKKEIEIYQFKADNSVVISYGNAEGTQSWSVNEAGQLVITGSVNYLFTLTSGDQYLGELSAVLQDADGNESEIITTATIKEQANCDNAYAIAFNSGYKDGDADGEITGFTDGYNKSYDVTYDLNYPIGYEDAYEDGYDASTSRKSPRELKVVSPTATVKGTTNVVLDKKVTIMDECGDTDGYSSGYNSGYADGHKRGYDEGSISGDADGATDGYNSGYDAGFDAGYEAGNKK